MIIAGLFLVLLAGYVLARALRPLRDADVAEWAAAHALSLTTRNEPMVRWYLQNARGLRSVGVVAGLVLPPIVDAAFTGDVWRIGGGAQWLFIGYLLGALYAEVSLVRPVPKKRAAALLEPRDVQQYLPRILAVAPRAIAVFVAAAAVASELLPYPDSPRPSIGVVGTRGLAVLSIIGVLVLERVQRWLIQRPQPFTAIDLVAADDAIRSQSLHSLAGSGLALLLGAAALASFQLAGSDVQLLRWTMWAPAVVASSASICACLYCGHRAWRVPRRFTSVST